MAKKAIRLDIFLQPGKQAENLEGVDKDVIVAGRIGSGLAQVDHPKTPGRRDRKCLHNLCVIEVAVVLAPVDFRAGRPVVLALDCPALQMTPIQLLVPCMDYLGHWLDPDGLEVKANPLARFVL
jgi:hypothetical protein